MDFEPNDDQEALLGAADALLSGRFDRAAVRAMIDSGLDHGRWSELAGAGFFRLAVAEVDGGVGLGWADAVLVHEQMGHHLVPGPVVATTLGATVDAQVGDGSVLAGLIERPAEAANVHIEHAGDIGVLFVADADGLWRVEMASAEDRRALDVTMAPHPLDPLTPVGIAARLPQGDRIGGPDLADLWRLRATVLNAALQLGLADAATELAVSFAKERQQFGKPIGQFQAIKHLCADMLARVEVARAATWFAGVTLDDPAVGDPARAAAVASIMARQAGDRCGKDCVQVHGGMGYTWEVDAHLFLKRSWVIDHGFGAVEDPAETVAGLI